MAGVTVTGVSKLFGQIKALDGVSIDFADGGFYALLGPSGSGKTTLLRMIAGFEFPDSGHIAIAGDPVENLAVEKRDIGMVFQNYALFPNMTVFDNVAFGPTVRGMARAEAATRVGEALELVRLTGFDRRRPNQLSGGQKQRVALARALVTRPRVLLLDEPLSALDKALRVEMQVELKRIQRDVAITTIFVTHDQEEALTLSDRIGILDQGRLIQEGPPLEVYERPATAFTARFLGDANLLEGRVRDGAIELADGTRVSCAETPGAEGAPAICAVRPEKMRLAAVSAGEAAGEGDAGAGEGANRLSARVLGHVFAGSSLTYLLGWQGRTLKVFVQNRGGEVIREDAAVQLSWPVADTVVVAP
jgi:ABC-type Fe3+/spermidine/putrescine transport system ATPase subunit